MKKEIKIGSVSIPLDSYVVGGTAILGIRESGKTYTAKGIAEQLLEHNIPIVVFDAIGVWRYLKIAGTGKDGKGFKVVVAGGKEPDLPLSPESAPEIVRAAIRENIPLVIDLYSKKLSKADWRKIVQSCFRTLLYENEGLRHIFLEETAEYAPQKVIDGQTYAEVEKLVRMGGNASLGITLINQRAQEVNKAILDLCENMVLMRQRGAHAIDSLEKWMDRLSPDSAREVSKSMPHMGQGDAWVFTAEQEAPTRTRSEPIRSFHPDRRKPQLSAKAETASAADTSEFVSRLSKELSTVVAQAEANDPRLLRKRISELETQLGKPTASAAATKDERDQARAEGFENGYTIAKREQWGEARNILVTRLDSLRGDLYEHIETLQKELRFERDSGTGFVPPKPPTMTMHPAPAKLLPATRQALETVATAARERVTTASGEKLSKAERLVLTVLAQYPQGRTHSQVAVLTGYASTGGGFNNAISSLRSRVFIDGGKDRLTITGAGQKALGPFDPLPHGPQLLAHWMRQLSKAERSVLEVLTKVYPKAVNREDLASMSGYQAEGGGYGNALSRLRTLELINGRVELKASDDLFE